MILKENKKFRKMILVADLVSLNDSKVSKVDAG